MTVYFYYTVLLVYSKYTILTGVISTMRSEGLF